MLYRQAMALLALVLMPAISSGADLTSVSNAVVKLYITQQPWDMMQPWTKSRATKGTCTGFFIKQGILTNAHCVADATYIQMELPGYPDKVEIELLAVNHQVDLALARPKDPAFRQKITPISFGDLPKVREKVVTLGYPPGGRQVSYTEGVVSRIDIMRYAHSNVGGLMVQTDAAINPGNSGGPVFSDRTGECLGVATQKSRSGEAIGYFIPHPVVKQFLRDLKDGAVNGVPALGANFQSLENPAIRHSLEMGPDKSGMLLLDFARDSAVEDVLQVDDVVLSIDGHPIFNDGRVPFRKHGKIAYQYYVVTRQVGDKLELSVLRQGKILEVEVQLRPYRRNVIPTMPQYDQRPRYYVIGGLVFRAVERRYFSVWGRDWAKQLPNAIRAYLEVLYGKDNLEELVVISAVFAAGVNKGYSGRVENVRVTKVNGVNIGHLEDVVRALESPSDQRFHRIELDNGMKVVLDREQIAQQDATIRQRYNIR